MKNPNFPIGGTESDPDSGKRKRGEIDDIPKIDIGGEIAKIDSSMGEEKETREVKAFEDRYDIIYPYQRRLMFEDEDFNMRDYVSSDDDEMLEGMERVPYDRKVVLEYISQVRDSFGFDVDARIPYWMRQGIFYFIPIRLSRPGPGDLDYVNDAANIAIREINLDLKNETSFELVEVAKAVITYAPFDLLFLTLAVKKVEEAKTETIRAIVYHPVCQPWELHQWMLVKPDATQA
ncbi:uncharacterized protein LOC121803667 [Salvia splendens]|nr:uncharacterized protein LOC121803667 [Salvia splendens]